ncbi:MAG: hypothetical protein KIT27_08675 [Legionellales bacterium]|nr:hypothetical protein [Legionellales bacterium]
MIATAGLAFFPKIVSLFQSYNQPTPQQQQALQSSISTSNQHVDISKKALELSEKASDAIQDIEKKIHAILKLDKLDEASKHQLQAVNSEIDHITQQFEVAGFNPEAANHLQSLVQQRQAIMGLDKLSSVELNQLQQLQNTLQSLGKNQGEQALSFKNALQNSGTNLYQKIASF